MVKKILCIEDNPLNMRLIGKLVRHFGYEMVEARTGRLGLAAVAAEHPDLILMDIHVPDLDGLEVTRRLKNNPHFKHIPIIAVTASAMTEDRICCYAAGCNDFIAKPIMRQELKRILIQHIGNPVSH